MAMSNWEAQKRYRARHPDRWRASVKKQNAKHTGEEWAAKMREYRKANPDKFRAYDKKRNATATMDPARRATRRACKAKRRAAESAALCSCCTSKMFTEFFAVATLVGYHVDHI